MKLYRNAEELVVEDVERLEGVDLSAFPRIEDFAVCLVHGGALGWHARMVSPTRGLLASLPWWDHIDRDMKTWRRAEDLPCGTLEEPFLEADEDWQIVIFAHQGVVHVMQGEDPDDDRYAAFFGVPADAWTAAWLTVAAAVREGKHEDVSCP